MDSSGEHGHVADPQESIGCHQGAGERAGRPEFVEFRKRIERLVGSLVVLWDRPPSGRPWTRDQESVEVKLESEAVIVKFFVTQLPWETGSELAHSFQLSFAKHAPVFLDSPTGSLFRLGEATPERGRLRTALFQGEHDTHLPGRAPHRRVFDQDPNEPE